MVAVPFSLAILTKFVSIECAMKPKFYLVGLTIAFLEEFITQGLLKRNLVGWIIPTIIAFLPFLIIVRLIDKLLYKRLGEDRAVLAYYVIAGGIGLMIEWFVIGLSRWSSPGTDPLLTAVFQVGMFSFWGSVAFAPRLLLDQRSSVAAVRKLYKRFLIVDYAFIYFITLLSSGGVQFAVGVISVLAMFTSLNFFYFRYFRILKFQVVLRKGPQKEDTRMQVPTEVQGKRMIPTKP